MQQMQNVNIHQIIKINLMDLDIPEYVCAITKVNKNSQDNGIIENDYNELHAVCIRLIR